MNEAGRIALLRRVLSAETRAGGFRGIEVGIGDDAAVLALSGRRLVWTVDEQVEGTHFRRDLLSWHDVGWRSFMEGFQPRHGAGRPDRSCALRLGRVRAADARSSP